MLQAAINIDSLMRRRRCGKLHGGSSHLLLTGPAPHRSIASYITRRRSRFVPSTSAFDDPVRRRPGRNIAMAFDMEKLECIGLYLVPLAVLDPRISCFVDNLPLLTSVFNGSQQTITSQPSPLRYVILPTCSWSYFSSLTRSGTLHYFFLHAVSFLL